MRPMVSPFILVAKDILSFEWTRLTRDAGILKHDWSDYRNAAVFKAGIGAMITASSSS